MEIVLVVLLVLNLAVLGTLVLFCTTVIALLKQPPVPETVYTASTYAADSQAPVEDEIVEEDESVPLEQFTPDFSKPIRIVEEEDDKPVDIDEIDKV